MSSNKFQVLHTFLNRYKQFSGLYNELGSIDTNQEKGLRQIIRLYNQAIPAIEEQVLSKDYDEKLFSQYQALFREMEQHLANLEDDTRHHIVIVIPIADRPQHLQACLHSILELCECFEYGGIENHKYKKISVLIADDSKDDDNMRRHRDLAILFTDKGVKTEYFGQDKQVQQTNKLDQQQLGTIVGSLNHDSFYHKGASITRNITYLRLNELANEYKSKNQDVLFYFVDSDQEFKINIPSEPSLQLAGLNYFYHLDQLFTQNNIKMLTGKVVGDPPVSPSVMASNFLNDVIMFLETLRSYQPEAQCQFHGNNNPTTDDAAYHDMANLFGFNNKKIPFHYLCPLTGEHDHTACFNQLATQLNHFFDGEHPTRRMFFNFKSINDSVAPARTVYTGNYVFKPEMLVWFIPFASLKLRMAGPVLGRLIRAVIGEQFVSANLPMLHKRTVEKTGQSEFRTGIERLDNTVDLSGEFERQYFGDVMLFSIEKLTEQDYPTSLPDPDNIEAIIKETETSLLRQYQDQHTEIRMRLEKLENTFNNQSNWWNQTAGQERNTEKSINTIRQFMSDMQNNFGEKAIAYQRISNDALRTEYRQKILDAICSYPESKQRWQQTLNL